MTSHTQRNKNKEAMKTKQAEKKSMSRRCIKNYKKTVRN